MHVKDLAARIIIIFLFFTHFSTRKIIQISKNTPFHVCEISKNKNYILLVISDHFGSSSVKMQFPRRRKNLDEFVWKHRKRDGQWTVIFAILRRRWFLRNIREVEVPKGRKKKVQGDNKPK